MRLLTFIIIFERLTRLS